MIISMNWGNSNKGDIVFYWSCSDANEMSNKVTCDDANLSCQKLRIQS